MKSPRLLLWKTLFITFLALAAEISVLSGRAEPSPHDRLVEKLKIIRIPEVAFVEASLPEALEFLRVAARKHDPAAVANPRRAGVNIVLLTRENPPPTVTLHVRNLNVGTLLGFITELTGYVYEVREQAVVIRKLPPKKKKQAAGPLLETEIYELSEGLKRRLTGGL